MQTWQKNQHLKPVTARTFEKGALDQMPSKQELVYYNELCLYYVFTSFAYL